MQSPYRNALAMLVCLGVLLHPGPAGALAPSSAYEQGGMDTEQPSEAETARRLLEGRDRLASVYGERSGDRALALYRRISPHFGADGDAVWSWILEQLTENDLAGPTVSELKITVTDMLSDQLFILAAEGLLTDAADRNRLAQAIAAWFPIFNNHLGDFLKFWYPQYKGGFGEEADSYLPDVLAVSTASAGGYSGARGNVAGAAGAIVTLRAGLASEFSGYWPALRRPALKRGLTGFVFLQRVSLLSGEKNMSVDRLRRVLRVVSKKTSDFHKQDSMLFLLARVAAFAEDPWGTDWPRIDAFLNSLTPALASAITELETILGVGVRDLETAERLAAELRHLGSRFAFKRLAERYVLDKALRSASFAEPARMRVLRTFFRKPMDTVTFRWFLSVLEHMDLRSEEDFLLFVAAMREQLERFGGDGPLGARAGPRLQDAREQLLTRHDLDAVDFLVLHPLLMQHRYPITLDVWRKWKEIRAGTPPLPDLSEYPRETRVGMIRGHYAEALRALPKLFFSGPEFVRVPARLEPRSEREIIAMQAFLEGTGDRYVTRIGALVMPGRPPALPATDKARAYHKKKGMFADTDNLFLIPMRNPLHRYSRTVHRRSATLGRLDAPDAGRELVAKGIGLPGRRAVEGVLTNYDRGNNDRGFVGGLIREEKAQVEEAEALMREGLAELLRDPVWKSLADFFRITQDNLFLRTMATFKPLALPVHWATEKGEAALTQDIMPLPPGAHPGLPPGLHLVKTPRLFEHLGLERATAFGKTSDIMRVHLYDVAEGLRMSELPTWQADREGGLPVYGRFLGHLGIGFAATEKGLVFQDASGKALSEDYVREFLLTGFLVRSAMVTRILEEKNASGHNGRGGIFSKLNANPLSFFDYDTVTWEGLETAMRMEELQEEMRRQLFRGNGALRALQERMDSGGFFSPLHSFVPDMWKKLYHGHFDALGKDIARQAIGPDLMAAIARGQQEKAARRMRRLRAAQSDISHPAFASSL